MLTIFTIPRSFEGHIGVIQKNAIRSWTLLRPKPEIILLGSDKGTAELAAEMGLKHIPNVQTDEFGTPRLDSAFQMAQDASSSDFMCYVNADIILVDDFMKTFSMVVSALKDGKFLLVGVRANLDVMNMPVEFDKPDWQQTLISRVKSAGSVDHMGTDYYVFPRGAYRDLKPFAIGRTFWDAWLLYEANRAGLKMVDCSPAVTAIHQNHSCFISSTSKKPVFAAYKHNPQIYRNWRLCGLYPRTFSLMNASFIASPSGLKTPCWKRKAKRLAMAAISIIGYDLLYPMYPVSYPLLWMGSRIINNVLLRKFVLKGESSVLVNRAV